MEWIQQVLPSELQSDLSSISRKQQIGTFLDELVETCENKSRFPIVYLGFFAGDDLRIPVSVHFPFSKIKRQKMPENVIRKTDKPLVVKDVASDPRLENHRVLATIFSWKTWMSVPVKTKSSDEVIGALTFASRQSIEIRPRCRALIKTTAEITGEALSIPSKINEGETPDLLNKMFERLNRQSNFKVKKDRKLYENLFEKASDGMFLVKDGEFIDCNQKAADLFGCSRRTLLQKTPMYFSPNKQPDGQKSYKKAQKLLEKASQGKDQKFEWKHHTLNGNSFWAEVHLSPVKHRGDTYTQIILTDITDHKNLQSELHRTITLFKQTLDAIADGLFVTDRSGDILYYNEKLLHMWKLPDSSLQDQTINDFINMTEHRLENPEEYKSTLDIAHQNPNQIIQDSIHFKDGRVFDRFSHPITLEDQRIGHVWGFRDVTKEREQREVIQRYADFHQENPQPVFQISQQGNLQYTNDAAEHLLEELDYEEQQYPPQELQDLAELAREKDHQVYHDLEIGSRTYSLIFRPLENKEYVNIYARDISRRKRSEEQLRQKKDEYESLAEASPDIIYRLDPNGSFEFISSDIEKHGYQSSELIGEHFSKLLQEDDLKKSSRELVLPEYKGRETGAEKAPKLFDERRTAERHTKGLEIRIQSRKQDSEDQIFEVNSSGLYRENPEGHSDFLGTVGIIRNITNRKQTERELKKAKKELRKLSYHDQLTGLKNRRYFNELFEQEWNRHRRDQNPLSLFIADIDFFKIYNDTYGHPKGDKCLKTIADVLKETVHRSSDTIARFGGEEFIGLLPDTKLAGARTVVEEIQDNLSDTGITFPESPVSDVVTFSVGVVSVVPQSNNSQKLIEETDKALYEAKNKGRNCVTTRNLSPR